MSDETNPFPDPPERRKHKNKKCDENYIIGEYFPCERAEDLENVKWLFGMENLMKIVNSVEEGEIGETVESLILEAKIRRANPVHGPLEVERSLRSEIDKAEKELEIVNKKLHKFKGNK